MKDDRIDRDRGFNYIKNFDIVNDDIEVLWDYIERCFHKNYGYWNEIDEFDGDKGRFIEISTGGWSDNEEILFAMELNNMFWSLCWVQSKRGGHYIFEKR